MVILVVVVEEVVTFTVVVVVVTGGVVVIVELVAIVELSWPVPYVKSEPVMRNIASQKARFIMMKVVYQDNPPKFECSLLNSINICVGLRTHPSGERNVFV